MNGDNYSSRDTGRDRSSRDHYSSRGDRDRDDRRDRDRDRDRGDRGDRDRDRDHRRRRSRSPRHSRREYEVDSYSSSREYREREREDRYSGRERREERGWERDRGAGRDRRRGGDDDDRGSRRDRGDLFEDSRRGGGGRRDRDGGHGGGRGERKKSATPPPKKKEPTPDLTDVVPILERRRRLTQWDIKPPGYENVTAEQAKLSGMFPLPGAPRQQQMDPSRLQAFMQNPAGAANTAALKPTSARQSKRLFVYNYPSGTSNEAMSDFFNLQLNGLNVITSNDPCISAQLSSDGQFVLLEFKSPEDATVALALDGISMTEADGETNGASNGASNGLVIKRPKDYIGPVAPTDEADAMEGVVSNVVRDSPNKLCISNIPIYLTEDQVQDLVVAFGTMKGFVLVKDTGTDQSRGIVFCEYTNDESTDAAISNLNDMKLGDQKLKVARASVGIQQGAGLEMGVNAMSLLAGTSSTDLEQGRVLQLFNMVTPEELMDNETYEEIVEDVREECDKYGQILDLKIPRPSGARQNPGVGKIFIKYDKPESAQKALTALAGRKFAERTVVVTFFGEEYFDLNAW